MSQAGPVIEVCETDCIRYIAPLENNDGFYVPELSENEKKEQWWMNTKFKQTWQQYHSRFTWCVV